ncbi:hypothetical protein HID58_075446 [Brassica napus]|uniref:Uncharacterized protein n=1 Tax=Brassica napus TaxID=3708 RepID=A0ABQ7YKV3_BRANA|nr:hypothetical protein HID58_075446 [Brassica napus]
MEGIDEVAPPSATGEDFPMEKKQWVLGQHRTRNLVLSRALDKSILGEEVEEDEMLMMLQITIICLSVKLAFK